MYSNYIVYIDESGDPNLKSVQSSYPIFVLSCCIFNKIKYTDDIIPAFHKLKFQWFGHDSVILRGYDMRKAKGDFSFLGFDDKKESFFADLNNIITDAPFTIVTAVINKARYRGSCNVYELALKFCMERIYMHLQELKQVNKKTFFIIESRGRKEDEGLELAFRRIKNSAGSRVVGGMPNFEIKFTDKKANSAGLQLADLVGTPIGHKYLRPNESNRAYDIIKGKFRTGNGEIQGYGLKLYP